MNTIEEYGQLFKEAQKYEKIKNFYFENHSCPVSGETIKVELRDCLIRQIKPGSHIKVVYFGICPHCKNVFYNEEDASSFTIK